MANRTEQKRKLRQERVAREAAAKASEQRRRRLLTLAATTVAALAVVGVLIAVSQNGGSGNRARCRRGGDRHTHRAGPVPRNPARRRDAREPEAPATMVEFVDLQCPFCADYTRSTLPPSFAATCAPES